MDTHFLVFKALGAELRVERKTQQTNFILEAPKGLKGADIYLDEASVTGTENALIAAAGAKGITIIGNAASEPHVFVCFCSPSVPEIRFSLYKFGIFHSVSIKSCVFDYFCICKHDQRI
jgi:hypothetical protein